MGILIYFLENLVECEDVQWERDVRADVGDTDNLHSPTFREYKGGINFASQDPCPHT